MILSPGKLKNRQLDNSGPLGYNVFSYHTLTVAMSDQQFVLRWHYHESTLVHNLPYFLDGEILTDVTLSVGSQEVKAHKLILAMCSVYFLQLFQVNL